VSDRSLNKPSGMNTTAGSYSLLGSVVPDDAGVVKRLRKAGAIILGHSDLVPPHLSRLTPAQVKQIFPNGHILEAR
jgi:hypothetical protein